VAFVVKTILAMVGASALICSASTVTLSQREETARDAALQWLQLVDAGHNEEAASQASLEASPLQHWLNYFNAQRAPLGKAHTRQLVEMKHTSVMPGVPDVQRYYIIRFNTSFERKPRAIEQITIAKVGCCWEVFAYVISDK
jgi:hypothetical protein